MHAAGVLGAGASCIVLELILFRFGAIDPFKALAWFVILFGCVVAHLSLLYLYRKTPFDARIWRVWAAGFTAIALLEGAAWGWASAFLTQSSRADLQLIIIVVTLVLATGSISAFGSYLPAFLAFFIPASFPYAIKAVYATDPVLRQTAWLMPLFIVTMLALGVHTAKNFKELVELRLRAAELAEHLTTQVEIAEQANLAKSSFLAAASHDLRQPVHAIGMLVGALRSVKLPAEAAPLLQKIETAISTLDVLFGALLDISRLDAGVVEVEPRSFDLQPLIDRICDDYAEEARAKGIVLRRVRGSAAVHTDPILMERILRNLVSNAVRYTPRGGVLVGCRRRGAGVRVEIWDTGIGIAPAYRERIFKEYFQVGNPERDREKGLGLGLAIVRRLVTLLDCPLSLRSAPGHGSCFSVTMPRARRSQVFTPARRPPPLMAAEGRLIAVIDDEAPIRDAMSALLKGWGYSVITAGSGEEIVGALADCPIQPDLIISDYRLRENETGVEVVTRLHAEYNNAIPALLISGDTASERLVEARASGLLLLHKPVANSKLRAAIVHLMAASLKPASEEG